MVFLNNTRPNIPIVVLPRRNSHKKDKPSIQVPIDSYQEEKKQTSTLNNIERMGELEIPKFESISIYFSVVSYSITLQFSKGVSFKVFSFFLNEE